MYIYIDMRLYHSRSPQVYCHQSLLASIDHFATPKYDCNVHSPNTLNIINFTKCTSFSVSVKSAVTSACFHFHHRMQFTNSDIQMCKISLELLVNRLSCCVLLNIY